MTTKVNDLKQKSKTTKNVRKTNRKTKLVSEIFCLF